MHIPRCNGVAVAKLAFLVPSKARCGSGVIVAGRSRKSSASQTQAARMASAGRTRQGGARLRGLPRAFVVDKAEQVIVNRPASEVHEQQE
jgi:hypothetical protein